MRRIPLKSVVIVFLVLFCVYLTIHNNARSNDSSFSLPRETLRKLVEQGILTTRKFTDKLEHYHNDHPDQQDGDKTQDGDHIQDGDQKAPLEDQQQHQQDNKPLIVDVDAEGMRIINENEKLRLIHRDQPNKKGNFTCDVMEFDPRFKAQLAEYAIDDVIVIAVTDLGYVEMALNLYESSFKKFGITNYLFVCSHEKAEQYLLSRGVHALSLWNDTSSEKESLYGKGAYRNKTNFKTDSAYMSLCLGYTTLLTDVDIVFLKNPMPYLLNYSRNYDLVIQNEYHWMNSGFYLASNRGPTTEMHERMLKSQRRFMKNGGGNQVDLNDIVKRRMKGRIDFHKLDMNLFQWGGHYIHSGRRQFAGDNRTTVEPYIMHNNILFLSDAGFGAKRYWFREFLMWHLDFDGYYTSRDRKYVTFEFPVTLYDKYAQKMTLRAAFMLSTLLKRTLILPKFYCKKLKTPAHHCNFQKALGTAPFPLDKFEGLYREHMFLHHPLVPAATKHSQSDGVNILHLVKQLDLVPDDHVDLVTNIQLDEFGVTSLVESLKEFDSYSVLRLFNLHNITLPHGTDMWDQFKSV